MSTPLGERRSTMNEGGAGGAPLTKTDRRLRGYAEIAASSLILGTSATLIQISTMPASLLIVTRMGLAGIVLAVIFFLSGGVEEVRRSGHFRRMVLVGFVVALEMLFYFASIRASNVIVGVSLEYMAPVFVALLAPVVLRTRRQGIDLVAVAVAVAGMILLVLPAATAGDGAVTVPGVVFGLLAGLMFATAMMLISSMGGAGILGYLEPVTAPLWAFLLIGEAPPWTTYAGGALIVAAGILVIVFGKGATEPLVEPLT